MSILEIAVLAGFAMAFLAIVLFVIYKLNELGALGHDSAVDEEDFEQQIIEDLKLESSTPRREKKPSHHPQQKGSAPSTSNYTTPQKTPVTQGAPEGQKIDLTEVAERLMQARLVKQQEGTLPLGAPPNGLIYSLKAGGFCAILPHMPGEHTLLHLSKRFDMVFILCQNGEIVVVERYQSRLSSMVDLLRD